MTKSIHLSRVRKKLILIIMHHILLWITLRNFSQKYLIHLFVERFHRKLGTEIEVDYNAILAMDFPNGLVKGQEWNFKRKFTFHFKGKK